MQDLQQAYADDLGRRLKARRLELDLSQDEAAEQIGVSPRALAYWEQGKVLPLPKHRRALKRFLAESG
jgi:transcriptional regulator with XRE-family HTH domain